MLLCLWGSCSFQESNTTYLFMLCVIRLGAREKADNMILNLIYSLSKTNLILCNIYCICDNGAKYKAKTFFCTTKNEENKRIT